MNEPINFAQLARQQPLVFLRLAPGAAVQLGEQALLVRIEGETWHCLAYPPWEVFTPDDEGAWYAVSFRAATQLIGFSDLISYRISVLPGRFFRLGFHAEMEIRAAHIPGLLPLMRSRDSMCMLDVLNVLRDSMQERIIRTLNDMMGRDPPERNSVTEKSGEIQKEVELALFPLLYRNGLCMKPHSFLIRGYSPPMLG